jgi:hypothetical protein
MSITGIPGVSTFAEELASKAAARVASVSAASAGGFGAVGLVAWAYAHRGQDAASRILEWLRTTSTTTHIGVGLAVLVGLLLAGFLSEMIVLPVLRLLEGYWPRVLDPLRGPLVARARQRAEQDADRLTAMAEEAAGRGDDALQRLLKRLAERPARPELIMPTRLGNLLRAHETRPVDSYGLDPVRLWTRLWLLLPDGATREISAARSRLDAAVAAWFWAVLSTIWVFWAWWAAPVGLLMAWLLHRGLLVPRADTYGDLVEAAFDLYRTRLYDAARWPRPGSPAIEVASGQALSRFLAYGDADPDMRYVDPGMDGS